MTRKKRKRKIRKLTKEKLMKSNPVFKSLNVNKAKTFKNKKKEAKNNPIGD